MPEWLTSLVSGLGGLVYKGGEGEGTGIQWQNILPLLMGYASTRADDSEGIARFLGLQTPQPTGYMEGIPEYTAVRQQVPMYEGDTTTDTPPSYYQPNRRPGSGGRNYFTNTQYVPTGKGEEADTAAIDAAKAKAATEASGLQAINLANLATESRPSMERITDEEIVTGMGDITGDTTATDRSKIAQTQGFMNKYAVSPERLSSVTGVPLHGIQTATHPYHQTEAEVTAATPTADTDIQTYLKQLIAGSQRTPYAAGMAKGGIAGYAEGDVIHGKTVVDDGYNATRIASYRAAHIAYQLKLSKAHTPQAKAEVERWWQQQVAQYDPAIIAAANQMNAPSGHANGGLASLATQGRYFGGSTDGMGDVIPATIDRQEPAMLSDGEFVIPADVVSHFGNGNSDAGAEQLFGMMDRVRKARTGTSSQGKEINPMQYTLA